MLVPELQRSTSDLYDMGYIVEFKEQCPLKTVRISNRGRYMRV